MAGSLSHIFFQYVFNEGFLLSRVGNVKGNLTQKKNFAQNIHIQQKLHKQNRFQTNANKKNVEMHSRLAHNGANQ